MNGGEGHMQIMPLMLQGGYFMLSDAFYMYGESPKFSDTQIIAVITLNSSK